MLFRSELVERTENDALKLTNQQITNDSNIKQEKKQLRRNIKQQILEITNIFLNTERKTTKRGIDPDILKDPIALLTIITESLTKLKMIREWRYMIEGKSIIGRELEIKDKMKQLIAQEARRKYMEYAQKKKEDLQKNLKIPRFQKHGKQMMKKIKLKEHCKIVKDKREKIIDDEFDDKYFID